ncbi:MAG TPA: hypothetical protein VF510_16055 [Ktedonobacterales bacterium]
MGELRVLSWRGDDHATWDASLVEAGDPEAEAAIREAERICEKQRAKGATAFKAEPWQAPVRIEQFDQTADQIVMIPRVVGG